MPSPEDAADLRRRLLARRADLEARRADEAAEARALFAAGLADRWRAAVARAQALEAKIARSWAALDAALALGATGSASRAERRAREICVELVRARLDRVRAALAALGAPAGERLRVAKPRIEAAAVDAGGTVTVEIFRKRKRPQSGGANPP